MTAFLVLTYIAVGVVVAHVLSRDVSTASVKPVEVWAGFTVLVAMWPFFWSALGLQRVMGDKK